MSTNSQYAFYGSLRKGMENYHSYENDLKYLFTAELHGFKMYSLTEYPYVVRTENPDHKIIVDLIKITNKDTEQSIHEMEIDAGYIFSEVIIGGIKFGIYVFGAAGSLDPEVKDGDWVEFRKTSHF